MTDITPLCKEAKLASAFLMRTTTAQKNAALFEIAKELKNRSGEILSANQKDLIKAKENGVPDTMQDRLSLSASRIEGICEGVMQVAALPDPIGEVFDMARRPNGLLIGKKRVPLGVIGIIFESRPNVTADAAVLCLKSGNAAVLRGGKEAICSNIAIANIMKDAVKKAGLPGSCIQIIEDTSHACADQMMRMRGLIDVLIPRGGAGLIRRVVENACIPVIETGTGNCHIYVDESADLSMAAEILYNAKTSRPSVCNAAESLVVHKNIAKEFLPMAKALLDKKNVELRGCKRTLDILPDIIPATDEDYKTEFLDYTLSIKIVDNLDEAIAHINENSTGHSECIITSDYSSSQRFLEEVDSAAVYVNASTRFTDGYEFGLGAEIGISTQKMHARGPMGLKQLTTSKFIIYGDGQIRK